MGVRQVLIGAAVFVAAVPVVWAWYLSVMHLATARAAGRLTPAAKALGYPWLALGLAVDAAFNAVHGTVMFMEPPRELLFTSRVTRLSARADWRGRMARWICTQLLDPFDPAGRHCR